jgi:hypothetical protein
MSRDDEVRLPRNSNERLQTSFLSRQQVFEKGFCVRIATGYKPILLILKCRPRLFTCLRALPQANGGYSVTT